MKKYTLITLTLLVAWATHTALATDSVPPATFWRPQPRYYQVTHAVEIESLVPMFLTGGFHVGLGYRYKRLRVRASVINGGSYNAETAGLHHAAPYFKRYYRTSPGIFAGYNLWKHLELYSYLEFHTFEITQVATAERQRLRSTDVGLGLSYQFFVGPIFYIQPGLHSYFRARHTLRFTDGTAYSIPRVDIAPVLRLGVRLWRKY